MANQYDIVERYHKKQREQDRANLKRNGLLSYPVMSRYLDGSGAHKIVFLFEADDLKAKFEVLEFTGEEGLSSLYSFNLVLVSSEDVDLEDLLQCKVKFTIKRNGKDRVITGMISDVSTNSEFNNYQVYYVTLVPELWLLTRTHRSRVFLSKSIPEIIHECLDPHASETLWEKLVSFVSDPIIDFEFDLLDSYELKEYICQYDESDFAFISRLMEREGIYYLSSP